MKPEILVIGGGMIVHDQLLPSLYQLQRLGRIGEIAVCARRESTLAALASAADIAEAFPGQSFRPFAGGEDAGYRDLLARMAPGNIVVVALPDHLHFEAIVAALARGQHVCTVKPLVLEHAQALQIAHEAYARGLVVGIEYHKRFDDRSRMARRRYRSGEFGEFRLGTACLLEKSYYRRSNFQNWMTCENSDAFTYIGCHYVDLVHFITGLTPAAVSVYGLRERFPNGNQGFLWTDARVIWSNGACLNVQNALGFPDAAPGSNTQGLTMYCSRGLVAHADQYRGVKYCSDVYTEPSPDYFQYVEYGGKGLMPVGYGYRSVECIVETAIRVEAEPDLDARRHLLREIDDAGILATPANSNYNELVIEAARESILGDGACVGVRGSQPGRTNAVKQHSQHD